MSNSIVERIVNDSLEPTSIDFDGEMIGTEFATELVGALVQLPGSMLTTIMGDDTLGLMFRDQGSDEGMQVMVEGDKWRTLPDRSLAANYLAHNGMILRLKTGL